MQRQRARLPSQQRTSLYLTDGGIETTLIYLERRALPCFAAFPLLGDSDGQVLLRRYFRRYAELARRHGANLVLESPTWRASLDWGRKLGFGREQLRAVNRQGIEMLHDVRREFEADIDDIVVSGCIGPRDDGYNPASFMSAEEAADFHLLQTEAFREAGVDVVTAITMTYVEEALGVVHAARAAGLPAVISFTTETDGRLPSGQPLGASIERLDRESASGPAYYMINCAHPSHFRGALAAGAAWLDRIGGIRANASVRSHAELDASTELDAGDPVALARDYRELRERLPHANVFGGCCGTDHRHVDAIFCALA